MKKYEQFILENNLDKSRINRFGRSINLKAGYVYCYPKHHQISLYILYIGEICGVGLNSHLIYSFRKNEKPFFSLTSGILETTSIINVEDFLCSNPGLIKSFLKPFEHPGLEYRTITEHTILKVIKGMENRLRNNSEIKELINAVDFIDACYSHDMKSVKKFIEEGIDVRTESVGGKKWYNILGTPNITYGWNLFDHILKYQPGEVSWVKETLKKIYMYEYWIDELKRRHSDLFNANDLGLL